MLRVFRCLAFFALSLGWTPLAGVAGASGAPSLRDQAATNYLRAAAAPMQGGDLAGAAAILEEGLQKSFPTPEMLTLLAEIYRQQGRLNDASSAAEEALVMVPSYAPAHMQLGDVFMDLGWFESAAESYRAALAADDQLAAARYRLVDCLAKAGQLRAAETECREFMAAGETAALCLILGQTLERQERDQEAMAAYDRAVELDPRCADAHGHRAGLLCKLGEYDAAAKASRAALDIKPDHAAAHAWLGLAGAHTEDYMGAYSHAVKAEQAGMDMSAVWKLLQQEN